MVSVSGVKRSSCREGTEKGDRAGLLSPEELEELIPLTVPEAQRLMERLLWKKSPTCSCCDPLVSVATPSSASGPKVPLPAEIRERLL